MAIWPCWARRARTCRRREEGAAAYLGMAVPDFPNMFLIYGPNTNLNHNSIITMLEIQQRYIVEALRAGRSRRGAERQTAGVCPLQRALAGGHDHVGVFRQLLQLVQERGGQGHQQLVRDRGSVPGGRALERGRLSVAARGDGAMSERRKQDVERVLLSSIAPDARDLIQAYRESGEISFQDVPLATARELPARAARPMARRAPIAPSSAIMRCRFQARPCACVSIAATHQQAAGSAVHARRRLGDRQPGHARCHLPDAGQGKRSRGVRRRLSPGARASVSNTAGRLRRRVALAGRSCREPGRGCFAAGPGGRQRRRQPGRSWRTRRLCCLGLASCGRRCCSIP